MFAADGAPSGGRGYGRNLMISSSRIHADAIGPESLGIASAGLGAVMSFFGATSIASTALEGYLVWCCREPRGQGRIK